MSNTANKILSDIRNSATSGSNPNDFKIEDSQILYWIDQIGAMLKIQSVQKRKDIELSWIQTLSCMDLEQVDKSECCEIETGCMILRTNELPRTIEINGTDGIIRVTNLMGETIPKTSYLEASYAGYSKFSAHKAKWFLKNNRVYIINNDELSKVNIDLVAESPSELSSYTNCSGSTCYDINSDYPCSLKMASEIASIVLKLKVYPFLQLPQDNTNNADNQPDAPINTKGL
jgi:hypothetical protein